MDARRMMARARVLTQPMLLWVLLWLSLPVAAFGAGAVSGLVLDGRTGQPVRGATLQFEGVTTSVSTDLNGVFQTRLEAGSFAVVVAAPGYESQRIVDVVVRNGQEANVSVVLMPSSNTQAAFDEDGAPMSGISEEITVQAEAVDATAAALLTERKSAAQIVDNIGSDEISKNSGSDAASALRRVTGISLQDDKYVYVRGLGDRYSNTQLNGTKIPSTEFERKVVPLDLFAADLLEKITVSKSYTPDQPGDFVAGVVELETKQFPPQQRLSLGVSAGHNSVTTGEPLLSIPGGVSSRGKGGQGLPAGFPEESLIRFSTVTGNGFTPQELEQFGEQLIGGWSPGSDDAPIDRGFKVSYGNSFGRLGLLLSAGWDNDYTTRDEFRAFYSTRASGGVQELSSFDIDYGTETVRQSFMANLALRAADNSQVRLRSLYTNLAEGEGRFQEGFLSDATRDIRDFSVGFQDQAVSSHQLSGDHFFAGGGAGGFLLEWRAAASQATTDEDLRQVIYERQGETFRLTTLGQSGFLFFNEVDDDLLDTRLDLSRFVTGDRSFGTLKAGVALTTNDRVFDGRRLRFVPRRTTGLDLTLPAEQIYTADNIDPNIFEIREVTNPTDFYDGDQEVGAAYAQADWSFGSWRFIGGFRVEQSEQQLVTFDRIQPTEPQLTLLDDTDVLPSLSVVYALGPRTSLRSSLSRTVNRPELRELAPFEFKALVGGLNTKGNPELVRATVDSFDFRWELFPSGGEVLAVGAFYKLFDDPIEGVLLGGADLFETYINADEADNYGIELEARKSLSFISPRLAAFTGILNYTHVESEIAIPEGSSLLTNLERPLSGQPEFVLNVVLEYSPGRGRTTARLLYNLVGEKVILGGTQGLPDVLEEGRGTLDVVWSQGLWRELQLKVSAVNLLDEDRSWVQSGEPWRVYESGRGYSLSLGYAF